MRVSIIILIAVVLFPVVVQAGGFRLTRGVRITLGGDRIRLEDKGPQSKLRRHVSRERFVVVRTLGSVSPKLRGLK